MTTTTKAGPGQHRRAAKLAVANPGIYIEIISKAGAITGGAIFDRGCLTKHLLRSGGMLSSMGMSMRLPPPRSRRWMKLRQAQARTLAAFNARYPG